MGVFALLAQCRPLGNAKTVLLVSDHHIQILKFCGFRKQCVGADDHMDLACGNGLPVDSLFLGLHGAGEQAKPHTQRL